MNQTTVNIKHKLYPILNPASVALVGASENPGPGSAVIQNLLNFGYQGKVFAVNPNRDHVFGHKCYSTLDDIVDELDLVISATSCETVPEIMAIAHQKQAKGVMVFASGYSEIEGVEGKKRQSELVALSSQYQLPVIGPNCLGFISNPQKLGATTIHLTGQLSQIHSGEVAIVSQSGGLLISALDRGNLREVGFRYLLSSGNEATVTTEDYISYLANDDNVKVIALIIEGIVHGRNFLQAVLSAKQKGKSIVIFKLGQSSIGQQAVRAHTGKLAGDQAVMDAVFRQTGIIKVDSVDELIEMCYLLSRIKKPDGPRMASIMISGGTAALVSDLSEELGIPMGQFSIETKQAVKQLLPEYASINNPLDLTGPNSIRNPALIEQCLQIIERDPQIDLLSFVFPIKNEGGSELQKRLIETVIRAGSTISKPFILMSTISSALTNYWRNTAKESPVPILEDVTRGFKCLSRYLRSLEQDNNTANARWIQEPKDDPAVIRAVFPDHYRNIVTEYESKCWLKNQWKLPVTKECLVRTSDEAVMEANQLGYPLALKVMSPDIIHKTAAGLVRLNIQNSVQLKQNFAELEQLISDQKFKNIDGILLQEMVSTKLEVFIGGKYDDIYGPIILFGLGGIFVEIYNDVSIRLAPVSVEEAHLMIGDTRALPQIIQKFGNIDVKGLAQLIADVSVILASSGTEIKELDINPVGITDKGEIVIMDSSIVRL